MVPDTVATRSCEYQKYRKAGIARTSRMGPFGLAGASATSTVATGSSFPAVVEFGRVCSTRPVRQGRSAGVQPTFTLEVTRCLASATNAPSCSPGRLTAAAAAASVRRVTDELCLLTATALARRLREGEVSAREVLAAHLDRIERIDPSVNAIVTLAAERAADEAAAADEALAARRERRAPPRAAAGRQGPPPDGWHPHHLRLAAVRRLRAAGRLPPRGPRAGRGRHRGRQDQRARVRCRQPDVQHDLRRHPQPLRPHQDLRRQ